MKIKLFPPLAAIADEGITIWQRSRCGSVADAIFLAAIGNERCHATHLLRLHLRGWQLFQLRLLLEDRLLRGRNLRSRVASPRESLNELCVALDKICRATLTPHKPERLNTGHLLLYTMLHRDSLAGQLLSKYSIDYKSVESAVRLLPACEDYYDDMVALQGVAHEALPRVQ